MAREGVPSTPYLRYISEGVNARPSPSMTWWKSTTNEGPPALEGAAKWPYK